MKFWRTTLALALIATLGVVSNVSAKKLCETNTVETLEFPFVMCVEMEDDTHVNFGNGFPWENSTFQFSSYRNQDLYPSFTVAEVAKKTKSIKSIHSRGSSFAASSTSNYTTSTTGINSVISVRETLVSNLISTFSANDVPTGRPELCNLNSSGGDITMTTHQNGPGGSVLSTCASCPGSDNPSLPGNRDTWCDVGDIAAMTPGAGLIVDTHLYVGSGNSGNTAWDITTTIFGGTGCDGPQRAFGSGSFANTQHLTTAIGVSENAFVWVFQGVGPPPPATVEQQIKEIVRLLLTPQGLRCSGLDLNPGNGIIEDTPFDWPGGKDIDPISPQVTSGEQVTGDEVVDDLRDCGWNCP